MKTYRLSVVIEKDENGYFAFCPELQGCYTQGETYEEVLENIKDAMHLHLLEKNAFFSRDARKRALPFPSHIEDKIESGEEIPSVESVSLTSLEVAV